MHGFLLHVGLQTDLISSDPEIMWLGPLVDLIRSVFINLLHYLRRKITPELKTYNWFNLNELELLTNLLAEHQEHEATYASSRTALS